MKKRFPFPGWLFAGLMLLILEILLHFWTAEVILPGRTAAVLAFALAYSAGVSLIISLLPGKWQKWVGFGAGLFIAVLYMAEYFMNDAYKTFMTLNTMLTRAGDVTGDYSAVILQVLTSNALRIGLVLAPIVAYAVFAKPVQTGWKLRGILALVCAASLGLGFFTVHTVKSDADKLTTAYTFDNAVRAFGLGMGMTLEASGTGNQADEPVFQLPETPQPPQTQASEQPDESVPETTAPPVEYGFNAFDLDYAALAESAPAKAISNLHAYVAAQSPSRQNEYTGMFAGKNLILITAESFCSEAIDPELTPTLYRLATKGMQFNEYYQPVWGGSTTTGEFTNVVGLVPLWTGAAMQEVRYQNMFLTIGNQLQELGYSSAAYHNGTHTFYHRHNTHTLLGYDTFTARGNGLEDAISRGSPGSDVEMMEYTIPLHLDQQPFSLYYMTISGHASYWRGGNNIVDKHWSLVEHLPGSDPVKGYMATAIELDMAMESLLRDLEEAGIADDTVIVMATDHYPYGLEPSDAWGNHADYLAELYGQPISDCFIRDRSSLIIWSGCLEDREPIVVDTPVYSLDILPTLSNLFGVEYDSRLLAGRDVFSDAEPLVLWTNHSWVTDKGYFNASRATFTPREGVEVEEGYVDRIKARVTNTIQFSKSIQTHHYYDVILEALGRTE